MGPKANDRCPCMRGKCCEDEVGIGVMYLQVQEIQGLPEGTRTWKKQMICPSNLWR
jgi:hypothetical protein